MSEAAKIQLLLRRGILPQRILEPEAQFTEYVQSRVQDLALEIAGDLAGTLASDCGSRKSRKV